MRFYRLRYRFCHTKIPYFLDRTKAHIYDATSDFWTAVADTKGGKQGTSAVTLGGRVFALGGYNNGDSDTVEEYSPTTNTWSENYVF